jgi:hypothetical protein
MLDLACGRCGRGNQLARFYTLLDRRGEESDRHHASSCLAGVETGRFLILDLSLPLHHPAVLGKVAVFSSRRTGHRHLKAPGEAQCTDDIQAQKGDHERGPTSIA